MQKKILFVSHRKARCGVYEFGKRVTDVLQTSRRYAFIRVECSSLAELESAVAGNAPDAVMYNYMPSVFPWIAPLVAPKVYRNNVAGIPVTQIGIIHDVTQHVSDTATGYRNRYIPGGAKVINSLFDYYIAPDPTLLLRNPLVYKTGRLIPPYQNSFPLPPQPVVGSFGFGTPKKGFENIVQLVQEQFDEAVIRLNIPPADFGDPDGARARAIAARCRALITKSGIQLAVTHDFMDHRAMLDYLAQNTVNVFLYEDTGNRGLSSALDNAIAVRRPVAVSDAVMFRHVFDAEPSIRVSRNSLPAIINNGFAPLQKHYDEWNEATLLWEYERILSSVFARKPAKRHQGNSIPGIVRAEFNRTLSRPVRTFTWLGSSETVREDDLTAGEQAPYLPVRLPPGASLNRILDNSARELYAPAVATLTDLLPRTMSRKVSGANVQQAFVFDTVYRLLSSLRNPRVLCVGSHEDTASMGLMKMGFAIEEIDPTLNYSLQEFVTKPSTRRHSYDVIFSTSVIEHDPDDESFVRCLADLLAPAGVAVLTCDYKDGWKSHEPKPVGNERFYTQHDLRNRLLPLMEGCTPVDEPQWDCPNPDFSYLGKFRYTFATIVVKKT
jgi:SAM-dependent methyltransferase